MDAKKALDALLELTRRLTDDIPLGEALGVITSAALELLPAEHASVRLLDEARTELLAGARAGIGAANRTMSFRPGVGVLGWVVDHGEAARVDDSRLDPRFAAPAPNQGFEVRSLLIVPLYAGGNVVGVLGATSAVPGAFDEEDELLARLLANCAVPPIDRARLKLLSMTDARTKALNARALGPRLAEELERARADVLPLAVALLDLDRFKDVNDTYGHAAGDAVLRTFADLVREVVRRPDSLVRRGGDEFLLLLPATHLEAAVAVAERLCEVVAAHPFDVGGPRPLRQTTSVGVAVWDHWETAEALEARADQAMYRAKRAGGNRVAVAPTP